MSETAKTTSIDAYRRSVVHVTVIDPDLDHGAGIFVSEPYCLDELRDLVPSLRAGTVLVAHGGADWRFKVPTRPRNLGRYGDCVRDNT